MVGIGTMYRNDKVTGYNKETCLLEHSWRIFDYIVIFLLCRQHVYF